MATSNIGNTTSGNDDTSWVEEPDVEVLTVFNQEEQEIYRTKFVEAGKFTGEAK